MLECWYITLRSLTMPATVSHSNPQPGQLIMSLELSKDHWKLIFGLSGQTRLQRRSVDDCRNSTAIVPAYRCFCRMRRL